MDMEGGGNCHRTHLLGDPSQETDGGVVETVSGCSRLSRLQEGRAPGNTTVGQRWYFLRSSSLRRRTVTAETPRATEPKLTVYICI